MSPFTRSNVRGSLLRVGLASLIVGLAAYPSAQQNPQARRPQGFIGGTVESAKGREAGVWVIAESTELPTKFVKIVVTADDGRFMLPELPNASYDVWVRGYGLVDSPKVKAKPGATLALKAVIAPTPAEAAKIYPANYWYSLLEPPAKSEFPARDGAGGNGIAPIMRSPGCLIDNMKQGCTFCHQLGSVATRNRAHEQPGAQDSTDVWDYQVQNRSARRDERRDEPPAVSGLKMFAD